MPDLGGRWKPRPQARGKTDEALEIETAFGDAILETMTTSKPRALRYAVGDLRVIYDTGDAFWSAPVVDMSESGLFVETTHVLAAGTKVTLMPDTPDEEQLPFELHATVVRINEYDLEDHWDRVPGMAFKIDNLSPDNYEQLRAFLQAHGVPVRGES
jgi:hypothetical protein